MGWFAEFQYLLKRQMKVTLQDKGFIKARFIQQILMGIIYGLVYLRIGHDDFITRTGSICGIVMPLVNTSMALVTSIFRQKSVLYKQVKRGVVINQYGSMNYFMSDYTLSDNVIHYLIFLCYLFVN